LINWGYDNEDNIRRRPLHTIIERFKWFKKTKEKEAESNKFNCPFMGKQTKSKPKRK
jgi:hypothetical protein